MNIDITAYREIIETCNQRIKDIQGGCEHDDYEVGMYQWRPGAMTAQRICLDCGDLVPGITDDEVLSAWKVFDRKTTGGTDEGING